LYTPDFQRGDGENGSLWIGSWNYRWPRATSGRITQVAGRLIRANVR
jgi:hypothetical protein